MKFDKRLFNLACSSRTALLLTILSGFAAGVLTVFQARFISQVIGQVFLTGETLSGVTGLLKILLGIIGLRAGLVWVSEISAYTVAVRVKSDLRMRLFEQILALGPAYTRQGEGGQGVRTGELANVAVEGIEALDAYFSQYLPQVFLSVLVPLTFLALIFPLDPLSALVLLLTAPLIPIFMVLIGHLAQAMTKRQWQTLGRLSAHFLDVLQGLATLKIFGRSRSQVQVIDQIGERFRQTTMSVLRVTFLSSLALEMISTLSTAVIAVEIGLRLLYGRLSFEQAFFVLLLAPEFYLPLRMLGARFHAGMAGVAAAGRIFEILGTKDEGRRTKEQSFVSSFVLRPSSVVSSIRFEDVHYTYPGDRSALKGVSFQLEPGQKTALVGPSGAGKSTVAALLLRFIEPDQGGIWVGDLPLQTFSGDDWRSQVAWVPQLPYLFQDTVAANIRLARPEASLDEVIQAARQAHAHDFIQRLPQGYETPVGERAARLSGGQARRIALARAFLKNAPVLILDEATANLDPQHEASIRDAVQRLQAGKTVLIIAHRLSTVYQADQILLLEHGQIVDTGDHASLLERDGLYRRLVNAYGGDSAFAEVSHLAGNPAPIDISLTPKRSFAAPPSPAGRGEPFNGEQPMHMDRRRSQLTFRLRNVLVRRCSPAPLPYSSCVVPDAAPLWRLLQLVAPFKGMVALSVLLGFATIVSGIGLMATSAYIIASAALQPSIAVLQVPIVGVRFFGISRGVFRYLERCLSHEVTFRLLARLRTWFYQALEPLAPARLAGYRSGDLLSRAIGDIGALENFYIRAMAPPLVAILVALVMAIFFSIYSPVLAVCLLVFLFLAGAGLPLLTQVLSRNLGSEILSQRASLSVALVDGVQGLADLLASGQGERHLKRIEAIGSRLGLCQRQMACIGGLNNALGGLLANLGMWAVLALSIPLVRLSQIDGVLLAVLTLSALASFEAVLPLPTAAQTLDGSLEAARRLFELVDTPPEVQDPNEPLPCPELDAEVATEVVATRLPRAGRSLAPCGRSPTGQNAHKGLGYNQNLGCTPYDLQVINLSFRYPVQTSPPRPPSPTGRGGRVSPAPLHPCTSAPLPNEPYALNDLTFSLPFGKRMAVVGPSGAGKSTLLNLLLRFWEFEEGEILLGGQDIRRYRQEDVRRLIGVVSQNTVLFSATILDNLRLARPKATEAEVFQAASQAQIHDFIQSLPLGYDTWIGEQGLQLSGGERQRLAIARALLKKAPLLILDEPTANLDALTEREVWRSIDTLLPGRTRLVITHRLVELEGMDEILVLREGCVVERGRHSELLELGGTYRRMWEMQRQALREET